MYSWLLSPYLISGLCLYTAEGIKKEFALHNLTIMQSIAYPPDAVMTDKIMTDYLNIVKQTSRSEYAFCKNNDTEAGCSP